MSATAASVSPAALALVVDDEPLILMETADLLTDSGFAPLEANSAAQALKQLAANPGVVLLITDVQMPGRMQGFELAREARRLYPSLSIIVCSGQASPGASDMPEGALFIDKPLGVQALSRGLTALKLALPRNPVHGAAT